MNTYECVVHYNFTSYWGGIESKRFVAFVDAIDESEAQDKAKIEAKECIPGGSDISTVEVSHPLHLTHGGLN